MSDYIHGTKSPTAIWLRRVLAAAVILLLTTTVFAGAGAAAGVDYGTVFVYEDISDLGISGTWSYGAYTITVINDGDKSYFAGENILEGTYKKGDDKVTVKYSTATPTYTPPSDGSNGYSDVNITPQTELTTGQTVKATFTINVPAGSISSADTFKFSSPLTNAKWEIKVFKGDLGAGAQNQATTLTGTSTPNVPFKPSMFSMYYGDNVDLTLIVSFSGKVSDTSKGQSIKVFTADCSSPKIGSFSPDPQIVSGGATTSVGGDKGEIVINSNVEGAKVELYTINNELAHSGKIANGAVVFYVYSTGTPIKKAIVSSTGYETASIEINGNPASGKVSTYTVNLNPSQPSITTPEPTTHSTITTLNLKTGWNFISVPKYLDSSCDTVDELLAGLKTSKSPIGYDPTLENGWYALTKGMKIEPLNGYWIYADEPLTINLKYSGDAMQTPPVKTVYKGWNAVGICADKAMTAKSVFANLNWVSYLPWDVFSGCWSDPIIKGGSAENSEDRYITLGSGGWIYADAEGTLLGSTA